MIVAATIHNSTRTKAIDDIASRKGRSTSVFTSLFDIAFRPAGTLDGLPANRNAVASGWPARPSPGRRQGDVHHR